MTNIVKKDQNQIAPFSKGKLRSTSSPFQQRVNSAKRDEVDPATMPNRICLMLDRSSSMMYIEPGGSRIALLKDAIDAFIDKCDFSNTALAFQSFPSQLDIALSSNKLMLAGVRYLFDAAGDTPMRRCVEECFTKVPMTRGVIVSDGEATDWRSMREPSYGRSDEETQWNANDEGTSLLGRYKEQGIPIDCVHISTSSGGEELLKRIAAATGGIFIKFTDVSAFSRAFGYLTPGYRAMLSNGSVSAESIGAKEIR